MLKDKYEDKILDFIEEKEKFPLFPLPLTVAKAENSCLFDINGEKYIDLTSNRENNPLGYSSINLKQENCFLDSELFNSHASLELEEILKEQTGLEKAYFSSNCAEIYDITAKLINIHLNNTGKEKVLIASTIENKALYKIQNPETELIPVNKDSLLKTVFSRLVGAVIIQLMQKTDEVVFAEDDYLKEVKNLCERNNALLIIDATNIAPYRLNKNVFNYNQEIKPDILLISKGTSQGFPLNAIITSKKASQSYNFEVKSGIFSAAYNSASEFIKNIQNDDFKEIISENSDYISKKLEELSETHISLVDYYSTGMFFTILTDVSAYDFAKTAFKKGIIVDTLNDKKIIISPPYNIKKEEVDHFISIFDEVFDELAEFDRLK